MRKCGVKRLGLVEYLDLCVLWLSSPTGRLRLENGGYAVTVDV